MGSSSLSIFHLLVFHFCFLAQRQVTTESQEGYMVFVFYCKEQFLKECQRSFSLFCFFVWKKPTSPSDYLLDSVNIFIFCFKFLIHSSLHLSDILLVARTKIMLITYICFCQASETQKKEKYSKGTVLSSIIISSKALDTAAINFSN